MITSIHKGFLIFLVALSILFVILPLRLSSNQIHLCTYNQEKHPTNQQHNSLSLEFSTKFFDYTPTK
jgi:hypothetical protein